MINKDLYMMKVAAGDQYEAPGGSNEDFNIRRYIWEKQHVKDHGRNHYVMYMEPSWATKPEVLKQYNIDYDRTKFMNNSINHIFQLTGENSGLQWSKYDDTTAKKKYNDISKNHDFYKNHTVIDSLLGVWKGEKPSAKTKRDLTLAKNELERINLKNKRLDTQQKTYNTDLLQRYTAAITPQRYAELSKLYDDGKMHDGYFRTVSKYVSPYIRDYSNQTNPRVYSATDPEPLSQKVAALNIFMDPVPHSKEYNQDILAAFHRNGENSGLPLLSTEIPGLKHPSAPRNNTKFNTTLAATGLGTALAGYAAQSFRIPNKLKNVAAAASLAGIATGLGGLAKERIDKHNNIMDKAKTIEHNRNILRSWLHEGDRYSADLKSRYNNVATPEFLHELNAKKGTSEYTKLLDAAVKPYVRDYSKKKTAAIKDQLSDTVYQPKDPYLRKFYTGEISSNDAFNYMADSPIYKDKDLEDTVPREYRHLGGNSFIYDGYRAPNGKYHKLRTAASIPAAAGMLGMFGVPVAALAGKGLKTFAVGAGLTALGAAGLNLADKLKPKDHMNLVENIRTDKAIQGFEAERQVAERATPWLLSHQRDDDGFLSDQDENEYFKTFTPKSKPYVRSFNVKEKTAALAEELNPVPKPKRKRSVFQKFVDTLSTNKAKHIVGVAGGISGMLTGKELLHSNLTPMRALGGVGVVGGATLGAKNIYGLYNDYFD